MLLLLVGVGACDPDRATADIRDAQSRLVGRASFEELPKDVGVEVVIEVQDLDPGLHGVHIHTHGACQAPSFETAGPHWNPANHSHGLADPRGHHLGDMPNLGVDEDGTAEYRWILVGASLDGNRDLSLLRDGGTSVVIHELADDQLSDPSGGAGARIACGVIEQ